MKLELRSIDIAEEMKVFKFSEKTCGCQLFNGQPCSGAFPVQHIEDVCNRCLSQEFTALDFVLLGQILANMKTSETVAQPSKCTADNYETLLNLFEHFLVPPWCQLEEVQQCTS